MGWLETYQSLRYDYVAKCGPFWEFACVLKNSGLSVATFLFCKIILGLHGILKVK